MKYYWIDFIDDFLYEKSVNQWLSDESIKSYQSVFNSLFLTPYLDIENLKSFTEINIKRYLWDSFFEK